MDIRTNNIYNKAIEVRIASFSLYCANTWMTLAAPLIIGLLASKIFGTTPIDNTEWVLYGVAALIHLKFAWSMFEAANKKSLSIAVDEILEKNEKYKNEIIPKAEQLFEKSAAQQSVIYLMTLELEARIEELNTVPENGLLRNRWKNWEKGLQAMLWHIAKHRTQLFGYKADSLYNMALYLYDAKSDELFIAWRKHDDRLATSNRRWKPGVGHVGLAFAQREAKICHDILTSSELATSASNEPIDKTKYRSFMSIPVSDTCNTNGKKPLGVLVFTSSHTNQFDWELDKFFALTTAKLLSIYIERNIAAMDAPGGGNQ
ncbi:GAF domain-containing protein [Pseudomonas sp. Irchel s3h9]|uniref:GAF domain-containing protein n=1 Tax=Pseudomonas sp. Irchel s3h9 TaxID=2009192 RepID=UPI000BA37552|nr:GAF domain-containing protein [Pseudomonas sp. Irchel s3h9]